mgnify:CR=1 FL=1
MKFTFAHNNFNVIDLDKSLKFYEEALGLKEVRRKEAADGSFILVYLGDATTSYQLELTWLRDCQQDTCPAGIATQNCRLRRGFRGKPEHVERFMLFVAEQLREVMASLGFRTLSLIHI